MSEPKWLTQDETSSLIRLSGPGRVLDLSFGPGGVLLRPTELNGWAFRELETAVRTRTEWVRVRAMLADANIPVEPKP